VSTQYPGCDYRRWFHRDGLRGRIDTWYGSRESKHRTRNTPYRVDLVRSGYDSGPSLRCPLARPAFPRPESSSSGTRVASQVVVVPQIRPTFIHRVVWQHRPSSLYFKPQPPTPNSNRHRTRRQRLQTANSFSVSRCDRMVVAVTLATSATSACVSHRPLFTTRLVQTGRCES